MTTPDAGRGWCWTRTVTSKANFTFSKICKAQEYAEYTVNRAAVTAWNRRTCTTRPTDLIRILPPSFIQPIEGGQYACHLFQTSDYLYNLLRQFSRTLFGRIHWLVSTVGVPWRSHMPVSSGHHPVYWLGWYYLRKLGILPRRRIQSFPWLEFPLFRGRLSVCIKIIGWLFMISVKHSRYRGQASIDIFLLRRNHYFLITIP